MRFAHNTNRKRRTCAETLCLASPFVDEFGQLVVVRALLGAWVDVGYPGHLCVHGAAIAPRRVTTQCP